jgi:3-methyl-2-oxobutanoate hydroxymethyltransferase
MRAIELEMEMLDPVNNRIGLDDLMRLRALGGKFAMLTAYDYPTAVAAQAAGVPVLLIGDSMGSVVLGLESTRTVPLDLMIVLGEAVRRGAPNVYLIGDMPYESMCGGRDAVRSAADRFVREAGCDAVKLETSREDAALVSDLAADGLTVVAHLGLRPQNVESRDQLRAQAREQQEIAELAADCAVMVDAGASLILLEAVPNEASQAVVKAVNVPVIGCGAGSACHGHVVVTPDLLGITPGRPPRFVPVLSDIGARTRDAFVQYVRAIEDGSYPGPQHTYGMRKPVGCAP